MSIACPYCSIVLKPRELKPGKYNPKCPKCGNLFAIIVGIGGDVTVQEVVQKTSGPVRIAPASPQPAPTAKPLPDTVAVPVMPPGGVKQPVPPPAPGDITDLDEPSDQATPPPRKSPVAKPLPDTLAVPVLKSDGTPAVPSPKPPPPQE